MGNVAAPVARLVDRPIFVACATYALLLVAFWFVARHFAIEARIHGHMASSFTAFALLLAPYWFFGFGAAEVLRTSSHQPRHPRSGSRTSLCTLPRHFRASRRVPMD